MAGSQGQVAPSATGHEPPLLVALHPAQVKARLEVRDKRNHLSNILQHISTIETLAEHLQNLASF